MNTYQKYKDSSIEWIGEIPEEWIRSRMAYNGKFLKGKGVSKSQLSKNGLPVILYGDIYTKYSHSTSRLKRFVTPEVASNSIAIQNGDILFTASGETIEEIGKAICYLGKDKAYAGGDVIIYRQSVNNSRYLAYLFNSYLFNEQKSKRSKGQIVVHVYSTQLRDIYFPIPKLKTKQTAIANYLDCKTADLDQLIAEKKQLVKLYQEEKTAIINQAVTKGINPTAALKDSGIEWLGDIPEHWEILPIKYTLSIPITDGPHETPKLYPDGIPFISAEAIKMDKIDFSKKRGFISEEEHKRYSLKYKPQVGDVYMIKSGATTGNLAIVATDIEFNIWSPLAAMRPDYNMLLSKFLFYFMKSKSFFSAIEIGWNYGTQQNIGMKVLENIRMVLPNIEEQTQIVAFIEKENNKIDSKITKAKKYIKLLTEYRTALISEVVTGKIKVID